MVQEESKPKKPIGFISGIALGAVVAGAATFLYKTKKGKKIRKGLEGYYQETLVHLKDIVKQAKKRTKKIEKQLEQQAKTIDTKSKSTRRQVVSQIKKNLFRRSGKPIK